MMFKYIFIAVISIVITHSVLNHFYGAANQISADFSQTIEQHSNNTNIIVLSSPSCSVCKNAKSFLTDLEVAFVDFDIDKNNPGSKLFDALELDSVPVIVFKDKAIIGFSEQKWAEELTELQLIEIVTSG